MGYERRPKTQNEKRQYYATIDNDLGIVIKVRVKRRPWRLPDSWNCDWPFLHRSWKKHRKTQYRVRDIT